MSAKSSYLLPCHQTGSQQTPVFADLEDLDFASDLALLLASLSNTQAKLTGSMILSDRPNSASTPPRLNDVFKLHPHKIHSGECGTPLVCRQCHRPGQPHQYGWWHPKKYQHKAGKNFEKAVQCTGFWQVKMLEINDLCFRKSMLRTLSQVSGNTEYIAAVTGLCVFDSIIVADNIYDKCLYK